MTNMTNMTTETLYEKPYNFYEILFVELYTVVGLLSVASNILVIFVVIKYRKLHQEVTNVIVVHLNVLQAVFLVATSITFRITHMFRDVTFVVYCLVYEVEAQLLQAVNWLLMLLLVDWVLKLYHENVYVKFCRIYKFMVGVVYVVLIFGCSITTLFCVKAMPIFFSAFGIVICGLVLVLVVVVMNVVHQVKKRKLTRKVNADVGLALANISVLCWCPLFLDLMLQNVFYQGMFTIIIVFILGFTSPIFNWCYLFCYERDYNVFFKKVLSCRCNDYENETFKDEIVSYNDANGVQIS